MQTNPTPVLPSQPHSQNLIFFLSSSLSLESSCSCTTALIMPKHMESAWIRRPTLSSTHIIAQICRRTRGTRRLEEAYWRSR